MAAQTTATQNFLIRLPEELATRLKAVVPPRKRNKFVSALVAEALSKHETQLAEIAAQVTADEMQDPALKQEMQDWNVTLSDGVPEENITHGKP